MSELNEYDMTRDGPRASRRSTRHSSRRSPLAGNRGNGSKWIRKETRLRIYMRDGFRCLWCDVKKVTFSLDHAKPRSRGGTNAVSNLFTSCVACNQARGDRSLKAFAEALTGGRGGDLILARIRRARRRKLPQLPKRSRAFLVIDGEEIPIVACSYSTPDGETRSWGEGGALAP